MSKPSSQPSPRSNFMTTLLMMVAVFLMFQTCMNPQRNQTPDLAALKTSSEAMAKLKEIDAKEAKTAAEANAFDQEAVNAHNRLRELVTAEGNEKKLSQEEADNLNTQASIVSAHIQLKNGIAANDTNRLRMAYNTLEPLERRLADKPVWAATPVEVTEGGQKLSLTGHDLIGKLVSTLSERNKSDYIWGFIPGGYQFIDFLVGITGHNPNFSYAIATFLLALIVRAVVFPLSQKQLMMSRQMSQLVPRLNEIKEKFKDDQVEMQKRTMELYQRYGINPFAGCLPALVQMPLFLTVYQCILHYQFEFTKGYFLWINPQTSKATNGIFAPNLGQQDYLLIAIYGITMVISTLLTPVSDPTQAKQQRMIGLTAAVIFPIMMCFGWFPVVSGFVLYWTFTNLFSMAQSIRAYRLPMPPLTEVNAPGGGVFPGKPKGRWAQMMEEMQKAAEEQQRLKNGTVDNGKAGSNGKPYTNKTDKPKGDGKFTQGRPLDDKKGDSGTGKSAKHKPKKRG
ncbi:membrane protein insertase YidC [bacterium]|nr:MAG: membrane protein insertase YidC [bacterium]